MARRLLIGAAAAIAVAAGAWYAAYVPPLPFNASIWRAREDLVSDSLHVRGRMAEGLVSSGALIGKSRDEIVGLLGPPPSTDKFRDHDLVYWLCPDRGLWGIDSEWLVMDFDEAGVVADADVIED